MLYLMIILQKLHLCVRFIVKPTNVLRYCILVIICLIGSNTFFAQSSGTSVTYAEAFASLKTNRDRLLRERAVATGYQSAAQLWQSMTASQKGVFLTITDYLGRRSFLNNSYSQNRTEFDTMLNHVIKLYAINGTLYNNGDCGGIENHRIYFQADDALIYNIRNIQFLPGWRNSTDLSGPHSPFTQSREGVSGKPRAQIHEWAFDFEATTLYRVGVFGINDPHIVEMDIDYDFLHHSNPECSYDGIYGRNLYQNFYYNYGLGGSAEFDYIPSNIPVGPRPVGYVDGVSSQYPPILRGWSLIPDNPQTSNEVVIYIDGVAGDGGPSYVKIANIPRPDVNQATGYPGNHGFEFAIPTQYCNGANHYITVYGIANPYEFPTQLLENSFITFNCTMPTTGRTQFDFNFDGRADLALVQNGNTWLRSLSPNNTIETTVFGVAGDIPVAGDYDGDGKADVAVFRPSNGTWYRLNSSTNEFVAVQFGTSDDIPIVADFDGDNRTDIAVFRPSNGTWYRLNSSTNEFVAVQFGSYGDKAVARDYDGDGKADIAVFRSSDGTWHRLDSSTNNYIVTQFGQSEDIAVAADYDGDGKADIAVYRPSNGVWYRLNSSTNEFVAAQVGQAGDIPIPADYDGDGHQDIAVFRPSTNEWILLQSTAGSIVIQFGSNGDKPIAGLFN